MCCIGLANYSGNPNSWAIAWSISRQSIRTWFRLHKSRRGIAHKRRDYRRSLALSRADSLGNRRGSSKRGYR
ncbi:MAG: hypothetical protein NW214_04200 [Pseudanabaenaceae cyanobacterium bins.39]|nr:hypothetical protein [Pseudanabaenaceae cyanobacterium bins.39]